MNLGGNAEVSADLPHDPKVRRRLARLFSLPLHACARSGDPWLEKLDPDAASWPLHLYDASGSHIDLDKLLDEAATAPPGEYATVASAVNFFTNPDAPEHTWSAAQESMLRVQHGIPSWMTKYVKRSRLSMAALEKMQTCSIVDFDVDPQRQTSIFAFLVPEVAKRRWRIIFDTLEANALAASAAPAEWRTTKQLMSFFARNRHFVSFDYKCFYFQFLFSEAVSNRYVGKVGDKLFRVRRCPMGHKAAVKHAHAITQTVAQWAIRRSGFTDVEADVIIDNVTFGGPSADKVNAVADKFAELSAKFDIIIGDRTATSTTAIHRGLCYDSETGTMWIKPTWAEKFCERVSLLLSKPTFERARSLLGMLNYVRIYFGGVSNDKGMLLPETFLFWKAVARWAQSPRKVYDLSPSVKAQISALSEFVASTPRRSLHDVPLKATDELLITDASRSDIFSGWGAILVQGDSVRILHGQFPLGEQAPIAALEMRAVALAMEQFHELQRSHPTTLTVVTDNTACLFSIEKMRTHSTMLYPELRRVQQAMTLRRRVLLPRFVPSARNPADSLSRGVILVDNAKLAEAIHNSRKG